MQENGELDKVHPVELDAAPAAGFTAPGAKKDVIRDHLHTNPTGILGLDAALHCDSKVARALRVLRQRHAKALKVMTE